MTTSAFDPASRFRFMQFIPYLERSEWTVTHCPNRPDRRWCSSLPNRILRALHYRAGRLVMKANRWRDINSVANYDVVFVNRDLAGGGLFFEKRLLRMNPRVVFDFDDAIFIGHNEAAVRWMCRNAAWVTVGNKYLANYVSRYTERVTVIPTVVDTTKYSPRRYNGSVSNKSIRIGWSGSDQSIQSTLFAYLPILASLQKRVEYELVIISNTKPYLPALDLKWTFVPWQPEQEGKLADYFDVGIMPLVDNEFQKGKCGLKLLQYMAAGIPVVASPIGVNREIVADGMTGFLAVTKSEWAQALTVLINDYDMRSQFGQAGRQRCKQLYSIKQWVPVLLQTLERVHSCN